MSQVLQQVSWLNRRRVAGGIGWTLGALMFLTAIPLLFWNEGRVVKTAKEFKAGAGTVVSLADGVLDPVNEGRLVHVSGVATTADRLTDERFGVSVHAMRLYRKVEMYQWREEEHAVAHKTLGEDQHQTEFTYRKVWSPRVIKSRDFRDAEGHQNPPVMPFEDRTRHSLDVRLGGFGLSEPLVSELYVNQRLDVSLDNVPVELKRNLREWSDGTSANGFIWTRWAVSDEPQIGDVRVSFWYSPPTADASVLAAQAANSFAPYATKNGRQIFQLARGRLSSDEVVSETETPSDFRWILRVADAVMMFCGLNLLLRPLSAIGQLVAEIFPAFADFAQLRTEAWSALGTAVFFSATMGLAWLAFRPLLGLTLVVTGVGVVALMFLGLRIRRPATVTTDCSKNETLRQSQPEQTIGA